jgi:flagellar biosynthesis regulator FlbT
VVTSFSIPLILKSKKQEVQFIKQFYNDDMINLNFAILPSIFEDPLVHKYVDVMKIDESMTTKAEFVLILLLVMNRIKESDMLKTFRLFDKLDKNRCKFLSIKEIKDEIDSNNSNTNTNTNTSINIDDNDVVNPITL